MQPIILKNHNTMNRVYNILDSYSKRIISAVLIIMTTILCSTSVWASFDIGKDIWICNNASSKWDLSNAKLHMWKNDGWSHDIEFKSRGSDMYQAEGSGAYNVDGFGLVIGGSYQQEIKSGRNYSNCCFYTDNSTWSNLNVFEYWNIGFNGGDTWLPVSTGYGFGETIDAGAFTNFTFDKFWYKCTFNSLDINKIVIYYALNGHSLTDYVSNYNCNACGNFSKSEKWGGYNLSSNQYANNPGVNTLSIYWQSQKSDGSQQGFQFESAVTFTLAGFKNKGADPSFASKKIGETPDSKTVSYNHYGTALSLTDASITGTDAKYFSVSSISETGVTIVFNPNVTGGTTGNKSATLTVTDAHSKSITINLNATVSTGGVEILVGDDPVVNPGPSVKLSGYVKKTGCINTLTPYGFYYIKKSGNTCDDVVNGSSIDSPVKDAKALGGTWNATVYSGLETETEYYYKPYIVNAANSIVITSTDCGTFTTAGGCEYPSGDVIVYTIDAGATDNPCTLTFTSFEKALADLKKHNDDNADDYWWDSRNYMLKKNIEFHVVSSDAGYGVKNDRVDISDINKFNATTGATPTKRLTIKPKTSGEQPIIWGMNLANSRYITVESMDIKRDSPSSDDGIGHSCILIGLNSSQNDLAVGYMANTDLEFKNCQIEGDNFCCIHASGIDGLYLENCKLIAGCSDASNDTKNWGASIKFMNCKNIKLLHNSFKGKHSNNIFAQNTQHMLVMDNVFWNDNYGGFDSGENDNNSAIIRLVNYNASDEYHHIEHIGIYYNTMYLANGTNTNQVDFLIFGGRKQGQTASYYDANTIEFKYNNCYSYSTSSNGKTSNPFIGLVTSSSTHVIYNNFWSAKDGADFSFGAETKNEDMSLTGGMVCKTAPNTPEGLIIRGTKLNSGEKISSDITGLGAESILDDRNFATRPASGSWTYGAYQTSDGSDVSRIVWFGSVNEDGTKNGDWDNRNNWYKEENGKYVPVSCVDRLSSDLEVLIPSNDNSKYKVVIYPTLPVWSDASRAENFGDEAVYAGTTLAGATKFASKINIEYGAALLGVENLNDGTARYSSTESHLTVPRKEWTVVGSVVKPFDKKTELPRYTVSEDFYLYHEPHVYMQKFEWNGSTVAWTAPFTQLNESVEPSASFAIYIADQYGEYKQPAARYYKNNPELAASGNDPHTYTLEGLFAYDNATDAKISIPKNTASIFNNAYPAVMNATTLYSRLTTLMGGTNKFQLDLYINGAWTTYTSTLETERYIKPQSGFMIKSNIATDKVLTIDKTLFDATKLTKLKMAYANSGLIIQAENVVNHMGSRISVWTEGSNATKIFNGSILDNAELYILSGNEKFSAVQVDDISTVIPLGIRNKSGKAMTVSISLLQSENLQSAILEDRSTEPATTYDLMNGSAPVFTDLPVGDVEDRFYLNLNYATEDDPDTPTQVTPVEEMETVSVNIYAVRNKLTVIASNNSTIESIVITDLAGRSYNVGPTDSNFCNYILNIQDGSYIVTVVTDKVTERQKVLIKK